MENPQMRLRVAVERRPHDPLERQTPVGWSFLARRAATVTEFDVVDVSASVYVAVQTNAAGVPIATITVPGPGPSNAVNSPNATPLVVTTAAPTPRPNIPQPPLPSSSVASDQNVESVSVTPASTPILTTLATSINPALLSGTQTSSSKATSSTAAAAAGTGKPTEGSASSTPMVAGAVVGSVGGLTVLLLIVLILMRWYKHRRRAQSVQGTGSNDSATNLAGPPPPPTQGGFNGPAGADGSFRVIGQEESKEMSGTSRRGIIPSPAFFSDRLTQDRNAPPEMSNQPMPPWYRTHDGYPLEQDDSNEISVIGGGAVRPPYRPMHPGNYSDNHTISPSLADGPDGRAGSRNRQITPFPPILEAQNFGEHGLDHQVGGFAHSTDDPSYNHPTVEPYQDHHNPEDIPGPPRQSDGISVTSMYRDSWPPGGHSGVKPLFLNTGQSGGVMRDGTHGVGNHYDRPESLAIWPGPGATTEIERWKADKEAREYALQQHREAIAQHGSATDDDTNTTANYPDEIGPGMSSTAPLQTQVQQHLVEPVLDDSSSAHRETLRPSPARTPQVHSAEAEMFPFPERASPHDDRNGPARPPGAIAVRPGEIQDVNINRKQVGGGGVVGSRV